MPTNPPMNIDNLHIASQKPKIYERGDSSMWTDDHISKKLLEIHLNPELDSASRTPESINKTVEFISHACKESSMSILDLGCGPGIYLEKLAELGHNCTGVDFSKNSISYARSQAKEKGLEINYLCQNYLELDFENQFDLIILIYTDLGVLLPDEREELLDKIHRALKPGGVFIFDLVNDKNIEQKFQEQQTWVLEYSGFWKPGPYMELANGFHYPDEKVFLKQHTIIDESDRINIYRFWTHYFTSEDVIALLSSRNFILTECKENILPATDIWNGENITFYKTIASSKNMW